jgi:hypothetical protein
MGKPFKALRKRLSGRVADHAGLTSNPKSGRMCSRRGWMKAFEMS